MAMVPPRAAEMFATGVPGNFLPIIPSFHRPELINFWINNLPSTDTARFRLNVANLSTITNAAPLTIAERDFLRSIIFRPMPWDPPNFTVSNPNFTTAGTVQQLIGNLINPNNVLMWDVDNDGDGIPDSIWIDPGLPVVTTADGRRYKRLASILIK